MNTIALPTPQPIPPIAIFLTRWKALKDRMAQSGCPILPKPSLIGWCFTVSCFYRSQAAQAKLYAKGRTTRGRIVTYARPGDSPHNFRLAKDLVLRHNGKVITDTSREQWGTLCVSARKAGLDTGLHWRALHDPGHVELIDWKSYLEVHP